MKLLFFHKYVKVCKIEKCLPTFLGLWIKETDRGVLTWFPLGSKSEQDAEKEIQDRFKQYT